MRVLGSRRRPVRVWVKAAAAISYIKVCILKYYFGVEPAYFGCEAKSQYTLWGGAPGGLPLAVLATRAGGGLRADARILVRVTPSDKGLRAIQAAKG